MTFTFTLFSALVGKVSIAELLLKKAVESETRRKTMYFIVITGQVISCQCNVIDRQQGQRTELRLVPKGRGSGGCIWFEPI